MAKINDFELRGITNFRGHEGEELIQGNVYYKGKKVGFYSQDAWGGMDIFDIDYKLPLELTQEITKKAKEYKGGVLFKDIDTLYDKTYNINFKYDKKGYEYLFMDLIQLKEHEDIYKKYVKKFKTNCLYIIYENMFNMKISVLLKKEDIGKVKYEYKGLEDFVKVVE